MFAISWLKKFTTEFFVDFHTLTQYENTYNPPFMTTMTKYFRATTAFNGNN